MPKTTHDLPEGYTQIFAVDLQRNKKLALCISVAALIVAVLMIAGMWMYKSFFTVFEGGFLPTLIRMAAMLLGTAVYILLHELIHGIFMKLFGAKKVKYGISLMYAYAGCDDYFGKASYITIALAPVIILGVVLAVLNVIVPEAWLWVVYAVQITNISGAMGDIYVTAKFLRLPKDILVRDTGTAMTVYSKC